MFAHIYKLLVQFFYNFFFIIFVAIIQHECSPHILKLHIVVVVVVIVVNKTTDYTHSLIYYRYTLYIFVYRIKLHIAHGFYFHVDFKRGRRRIRFHFFYFCCLNEFNVFRQRHYITRLCILFVFFLFVANM